MEYTKRLELLYKEGLKLLDDTRQATARAASSAKEDEDVALSVRGWRLQVRLQTLTRPNRLPS